MSKSIYICENCKKDVSDITRYRVYVRKFSFYKDQTMISTMDLCTKCYKLLNIEIMEKEKKSTNPKEKTKNTFILNPILNTIRKPTWKKPIQLTERESRLLAILSNGYMNTWEDMNHYIYKDKETKRYAPGGIKQSLKDKFDINIRTVHKMRIYIR